MVPSYKLAFFQKYSLGPKNQTYISGCRWGININGFLWLVNLSRVLQNGRSFTKFQEKRPIIVTTIARINVKIILYKYSVENKTQKVFKGSGSVKVN